MEQDIISDYKNRAAAAAAEAAKYEKLANQYSLLRLVVFGLFILSVVAAISLDEIVIIIVSAAALSLCFAWLVKKQGGFDSMKNYFLDIEKVNENEIGSMQNGTNIYPDGSEFISDKHYYTSDLDIFGPNSLFQLVNRAATTNGINKLAAWLSAPAKKETILARQQAVDEIAAKNDWKIHTQANLVFGLKQGKHEIRNLFAYLQTPVELERQWLYWYCRVAPYLLGGLIIIAVFYTPARYAAGLAALFNLRLVVSKAKIIKKTDLVAGKIGEALGRFVFAFKGIENEKWKSDYLAGLSEKIGAGQQGVSASVKQLAELIDKLNYHLNIVMAVILNALFVWDIRQVIAIEEWKKNNRQNLEDAFDVLAEFEAVISLASLHINYPHWCFPVIADGAGYTLSAREIAHPLIGHATRVANDYELEDTFKIDIITGSNMAGKSTFLRTLGVNTVLALSGAPVCARSMQVSVMTILSYMRIRDSLNESTSTFKAELDRLQMLLATADSDRKVFFLIDEMLRGTNSVDKYRGSKAVIEQLIRKKAVGLVATHDLQIAQLEQDHPDYVRNFYFDIRVKDGEMLFDYKIRHGECKTFNASLLLKRMGIDVDSSPTRL